MDSSQKRHLHDVIQGMLDAVVTLPATTKAMRRWDAQLRVSAKARRAARWREAGDGPPTDAQRSATETFTSATAGRDLWDSGLFKKAAALLRTLGYHGSPDLSFHLVTRFVRVKAGAGGCPVDAPEPDYTPGWGHRFAIPASWPASYVREHLKTLSALARDAEKAATRRGRPAAGDADVWRRRGRLYFLHRIGRRAVDLFRTQHRELGPRHAKAKDHSDTCEACEQQVKRDLALVRTLIAASKDN